MRVRPGQALAPAARRRSGHDAVRFGGAAIRSVRQSALALLLALIGAFSAGSARADLGTAIDAYNSGRFEEAAAEFTSLAASDDDGAQTWLGYLYQMGQGVPQDYAEAMRWYRKAAQRGNADAQNYIGDLYYYGRGVEADFPESVRWYRQASDNGSAAGQVSLGYAYEMGEGVDQVMTEAARWYRAAAEQGSSVGQNNLANLYHYGRGVAQDYAEAERWYRAAVAQDNSYAQLNFGDMYYHGTGVAQDFAEAARLYRLSADQGNARGQYSLGTVYESGEGVARDAAQALYWYRLAAAQGQGDADEAAERLAATGVVAATEPAAASPADAFVDALPEGVSTQEFADVANAPASSGEPAATDAVSGTGMSENRDLLELHAAGGDAAAQFRLGELLAQGADGTAPDALAAAIWYRRAALQGYAAAQAALGELHLSGRGVPQDRGAAGRWLQAASDQGNAAARAALDRLPAN